MERRRHTMLAMAGLMMAISGTTMLDAPPSVVDSKPSSPKRKKKFNFFPDVEPTAERMKQIETESKNIQQLHRFVIRGKEVWARNKKDALKRAQ